MYQENELLPGQINIFDLGIWSGKMSPEHSPQTREKILEPSSKKRQGSQTKKPLFLDLRGGQNGLPRVALWEMGGALLGEYTMHSFGECPNEERESHLSQILEEHPLPKYSLSAKACQGILNRAERRGKNLPPILKEALVRQSAFKNEQENQGGVKESSSKENEQEPSQPSTTKTYCLQGNGIDRADTAGCNGSGWREGASYTLNTIDRHAVCVSQDAYDKYSESDKSATIKQSGGVYGGGTEALVIQKTTGPLMASGYQKNGTQEAMSGMYIVQKS